MVEKECAKQLIDDYQELVEEMLTLLKQNVKDYKIDLSNDEARRGILKDAKNRVITYGMHGCGCLFKIDNKVVIDIDYAKPRYDAIDYWFVVHYFESCSEKYPEIKNRDHLEELLGLLTSEQYLIKHEYHYYIQSKFAFPKVFHWSE